MHPLIISHADEIEELCRRTGVARLDLFGSAAGGDFDIAASDFDFLVSFKSEARRRAFDNFFDLKEGLAKVLGRSVDLLTADSLRNPILAREIEASRQNLYVA